MLSAGDTSYPLLNATPSARELDEAFTPNLFELAFAEKHANRPQSLMGLLLLLKTFQQVGSGLPIFPLSIVRRVTHAAGLQDIPEGLADDYDSSRTRGQHLALVRSYIGVKPFDRTARTVMLKGCVDASRVREDLADIINLAMEELFRDYLID